jgi:hypothetical protein
VVAVADHGGDLDALAAVIEDGGQSFWSGTVEAGGWVAPPSRLGVFIVVR